MTAVDRPPAGGRTADAGYVVVFAVADRRLALPMERVTRVVRSVAVTPLPGAPPAVAGVIDVHGDVVPVFDLRRRLGLEPCHLSPEHHFVLARTATRDVALWVDRVEGVVDPAPGDRIPLDALAPPDSGISGLVRLSDGLTLVHDLDAFLTLAEEQRLDAALDHRGARS